ncbi:hypothetical protein CKAH01_07789 [Colletotrichum kahawae]|uniref:Uncharacterized protein n=1 Tax=Colletotrichum kahawae TaxID=34407 RepID=A0AAE0D1F3_COLKA|nr:hypothetical protein CKAH01_07789 [Colletotrichum kahawae]
MAMTTVPEHEPQWELAELNSMRLAQNDEPLAARIGVTRKGCKRSLLESRGANGERLERSTVPDSVRDGLLALASRSAVRKKGDGRDQQTGAGRAQRDGGTRSPGPTSQPV